MPPYCASKTNPGLLTSSLPGTLYNTFYKCRQAFQGIISVGKYTSFFSFFFVLYCFLFYLKIKDTEKLSSQRLFNIKKLRKYVKEGVKVKVSNSIQGLYQ